MPLDPIVKAFLDQMAAQGAPPLTEQTVEQAREAVAAYTQIALPPMPVARVDDRKIPGPAGEIPVRVYTPDGVGPFPGIVFTHGGGWVLMSVETHDTICRALANQAGAVVVSVEYRLAPEHKYPAAAEDAYAAVRWVADNAPVLNVDASRLGVVGDSAGGNLAAAVTLMARDRGGPPLAFQALLFPVLDHNFETRSYVDNAEGFMLTRASMEWFWNHYLASPDQGREPYASPLRAQSHAGLPPAYVATAEFDPLRDEGEAYAKALEAAGVPVELVRYEGQIHDFILMGAVLPQAAPAVAAVAAAAKKALGG